LENFLYDICGCAGDWKMSDFAGETVEAVRRQVGSANVICGLSGGVDSSVTASLIHKAIGEKLICIFVDNGLLRKNEREHVISTFRNHFHMDLRVVDWSKQFLAGLAGVTDPQQKRKIIGAEFIKAFESEAAKIPNAKFLAQGTLYPDVIESGVPCVEGVPPSNRGQDARDTYAPAANIKLHHNVGGLPAELGFELVEPLRDRAADEILIDEIKSAGLYRKISQALAVLLPISTVGVMGDERSYENVVAIRAVETVDFMTADFSRIPYEVLAVISNRIINEVRGVNRVVYDVSSKPPATIEWE